MALSLDEERIVLRLRYNVANPARDDVRVLLRCVVDMKAAGDDQAALAAAARKAYTQLECLRYQARKQTLSAAAASREKDGFLEQRKLLQDRMQKVQEEIQRTKVDLSAAQKKRKQLETYEAKGKDIVKQPKRSASAAAMLQAEKSIAELRQGKADAEGALLERRQNFLQLMDSARVLQQCCAEEGAKA